MTYVRKLLIWIFFLYAFISCQDSASDFQEVHREQLLADIEYLSSDELEGRRTGTEGNRLAQNYIEERFNNLGLLTFMDSYRHTFDHANPDADDEINEAVNLIGYVQGSEHPERFIAVTAHYDHLGVQDEDIYNGADDNASGTGGLMAAARYFMEYPPSNSIMFIAFDAEEQGLSGARYFTENPVISLDEIVLNVNMDMISTNFENELYAVGTYHYPFLKPLVEESTADASIHVRLGYDSDDWPQDWTLASDHGPFHQKGIPFIYFGVEDHEHYHAPSDIFENINPDFYVDAVHTIIKFIHQADSQLEMIDEESER